MGLLRWVEVSEMAVRPVSLLGSQWLKTDDVDDGFTAKEVDGVLTGMRSAYF